jgi:hypothetical protein
MFVSPGTSTLFQYDAEFGVANDVTVTPDGASVVIHDAGEPIIANECEQVDEHTVRCTPGPDATAVTGINTNDGDDRIAIAGVTNVRVSARSGDDEISTDVGGSSLDAGSGADLVTGSPGDDLIIGAQGKDRLYAGAGDDIVAGDALAGYLEWDSDVIDGGPGQDVVFYGGRINRGVKVDLTRTGGQGGPGENDLLTGFEGVETSGGRDRITAPTLSAKCGRWKRDDVVRPGPQAIIARDCWRTYVDSSLIAFTDSWTLRDGTFSLRLRSDDKCRADVALFDGSTRLGGTSVSLPGDETRTAGIATTHKGPVRVEARGCGPLLAFSLEL